MSKPIIQPSRSEISGQPAQPEAFRRIFYYTGTVSTWIDRTVPHVLERWLFFLAILLLFIVRILMLHQFYLVTYTLGIYLLNLFLAFIQPKFDPSVKNDPSGLGNDATSNGDDGDLASPLPTINTNTGGGGGGIGEEFRPFIRKLPEFKFWYHASQAVLFSLACTLFQFMDIPVFWPILLMYFILLVFLTLRRQIKHMKKYKYVPFDIGKKGSSK
ncbi:hypothetical protein MIR68_012307 [Amoeboaphelidium protococcarum]|nr:hypothetical protein MIR68_012307 [Amoeboaphelidium protococcarum]